jgi:hypothetical protein
MVSTKASEGVIFCGPAGTAGLLAVVSFMGKLLLKIGGWVVA